MMNTQVVNASVDLQWEVVKNNSAFLKNAADFPPSSPARSSTLLARTTMEAADSSSLRASTYAPISRTRPSSSPPSAERGSLDRSIANTPAKVPVTISIKKDSRTTLKSVKALVKRHNPRMANVAAQRTSHLLRAIRPKPTRYGKSTVKTEA
ncbi:hypothetical protein L596_014627 [Steinernema carpocapsae]|uniref:60S ribosomal protein L28 n=1 Tax=Steinernema carpocapsae TaxID=34508 RepID=A0A4U5ND94_STECR|nr:hypothetical protein L596_014627 [Steinernema carpocapsae]